MKRFNAIAITLISTALACNAGIIDKILGTWKGTASAMGTPSYRQRFTLEIVRHEGKDEPTSDSISSSEITLKMAAMVLDRVFSFLGGFASAFAAPGKGKSG